MRRRRLWYGFKVRARPTDRLLAMLLRPRRVPADLIRLGDSDYGAQLGNVDYGVWWVPESVLKPGAVAYCAGAGEDIAFDQALLARGMSVVTFDPTPKAVKHVEGLNIDNPNFRFFAVGWWDTKTELRFYLPSHPQGVSCSAVPNDRHRVSCSAVPNDRHTDDYFVAAVNTPAAFARELGHRHIALVKMDIEGAETRVLPHMLRHGPKPDVLCVEFDDDNDRHVVAAVVRLMLRGYRPVKGGPHTTFIRSQPSRTRRHT